MCDEDGRRIPYMCANETSFNQKFRVCDWNYNVDCASSPDWYYLNDLTYRTDPPKSTTEAYNVRRKKSKWSRKEPVVKSENIKFKTQSTDEIDTIHDEASLEHISSDSDVETVNLFENTKINKSGVRP